MSDYTEKKQENKEKKDAMKERNMYMMKDRTRNL